MVVDLKKRIEQLTSQKTVLKTYLLDKFNNEDWHGVCDAANDLRELEAELYTLEVLSNETS